MNFNKKELIKSPLNYTGGKYKLLPQILPLFPDKIDTFIDLFAGGCNVGINTKANKIICNDIEEHIIDLMRYFKNINSKQLIEKIEFLIKVYGLSDTYKNGYKFYNCDSSKGVNNYNKQKYIKLRNDYNKNTANNLMFFITVLFAFNNQIRFNSKNKFNMPVNKRDFNKNIRNNTIGFVDKIKKQNINFIKSDFRVVFDNLEYLSENSFIYCDPPYLVTCASYNERNKWCGQDEIDLLKLLDKIHIQGIKFALNNMLESKGKKNNILINWLKINKDKYKIHYLNSSHSNCNYHKKDKNNNAIEVLITNY